MEGWTHYRQAAKIKRDTHEDLMAIYQAVITIVLATVVPLYAAGISSELLPPRHVLVAGEPLDVEPYGQAAPFFGDVDGDGVRDLLVGQYEGGKLRIYRNVGTDNAPLFDSYDYLRIAGQDAAVPSDSGIGFTPQLVDLDRDGLLDIISGSWPGEIYWFRQLGKGHFAEGRVLQYENHKPINVGRGTAAFVTDWGDDGDWDLVIGTAGGRIDLVENRSSGNALRYASSRMIDLAGAEREVCLDAAPVVADWDADGKNDLLVGAEDGSVFWYRNEGTVKYPRFAAGRCLVPESPLDWRADQNPKKGEWGLRSRICVTDFNGDGKLDLLVGDLCGGVQGKPSVLVSERKQERAAIQELPELKRHWAECFRFYRTLPSQEAGKATGLLKEIRDLRERIAAAQQAMVTYRPQRQSHGFVWLFLRRQP